MPPPSNRPGRVYLEKPVWREMVAPYKGAGPAPTIRDHLRYSPGWIWACGGRCRCMKALPLAPMIERFGLDISLPALRLRLRCETCGENPAAFSCPSFGREQQYRFPPPDRVPAAMRGYALVDPTHTPAPLRG